MKKLAVTKFIFFVLTLIGISSCKKNDNINPISLEVPDVYKKIYGAESITNDGTWIYIKTKFLPDHKSVYYIPGDSLYEPFSGITFGGIQFRRNPNTIIGYSSIFKIPLNPALNNLHAATPLGPIGIALNGVPFFNQYAGPTGQPLKNEAEIESFDKYYGHPTEIGMYHYHVEPIFLTTMKSTKYGLMGFLLDGFPVYGPMEENGTIVNNSNLDAFHGHIHATADFPNGIYHYHFTSEAPYLNGNGFYGTPGTISY
ncbi:MAG: YHYH protein [Sediminibacterium sp.]|nr:YHYH protein [Sediminibacterium sp.]